MSVYPDLKDIVSELPYHDTYDFFGRKIALVSDNVSLLSYFENRFSRFKSAESRSGAFNQDCVHDYFVMASEKRFIGSGFLGSRQGIIPISSDKVLSGLAAAKILNDVLGSIPGFIFFHGAGISYKGNGFLMLGDSYVGKTTLALKMLTRGCSFFSDDVCAARLAPTGKEDSPMILPFPKGLGIRENTLEMLGVEKKTDFKVSYYPDGREKLLLDVCDIIPDSIAGAAPVKAIFFMVRKSLAGNDADNSPVKRMCMVLGKKDKDFLFFLKSLNGVSDIQEFVRGEFWGVHFDVENGVVNKVNKFCYEEELLVIDSWIRGTRFAKIGSSENFDVSPSIYPVSKVNGMMNLLQHFWGGLAGRYVYGEREGGMVKLLKTLRDFSLPITFYRLEVGRLSETADLLGKALITE